MKLSEATRVRLHVRASTADSDGDSRERTDKISPHGLFRLGEEVNMRSHGCARLAALGALLISTWSVGPPQAQAAQSDGKKVHAPKQKAGRPKVEWKTFELESGPGGAHLVRKGASADRAPDVSQVLAQWVGKRVVFLEPQMRGLTFDSYMQHLDDVIKRNKGSYANAREPSYDKYAGKKGVIERAEWRPAERYRGELGIVVQLDEPVESADSTSSSAGARGVASGPPKVILTNSSVIGFLDEFAEAQKLVGKNYWTKTKQAAVRQYPMPDEAERREKAGGWQQIPPQESTSIPMFTRVTVTRVEWGKVSPRSQQESGGTSAIPIVVYFKPDTDPDQECTFWSSLYFMGAAYHLPTVSDGIRDGRSFVRSVDWTAQPTLVDRYFYEEDPLEPLSKFPDAVRAAVKKGEIKEGMDLALAVLAGGGGMFSMGIETSRSGTAQIFLTTTPPFRDVWVRDEKVVRVAFH